MTATTARGSAADLAVHTSCRTLVVCALVLGSALKVQSLVSGGAPTWRFLFASDVWLWATAVIELAIATLLASYRWRVGAVLTLLLLAGFAVATTFTALSGTSEAGCGCFGRVAAPLSARYGYIAGLAILTIVMLLTMPRAADVD